MVQCVVYKNVSSLWLSDGCSKLWDQQHWTPTPQTSVMYMGWAGCSCQLTADLSVLWWLAVAARRRSLVTGRSVPDERADTACTVSERGLATNAAWWWQDMDMPDSLLGAVQKWLNRSICHLGCGVGWAEGSTGSIVFGWWCQCSLMRAHWRHLANTIEPLSAASMQPYVKLLWPLVTDIFGMLHMTPLTTRNASNDWWGGTRWLSNNVAETTEAGLSLQTSNKLKA